MFSFDEFSASYSGDQVNKWYEWYSASSDHVKGGLSAKSLASKFRIPENKMRRCLRALGLTKTSPNKAPWVLTKAKGDLSNLAQESVEQSIQDLEESYKVVHEEKRHKFFRDEYFKYQDKEYRSKRFAELMSTYSESIPFERARIDDYADLFDRNFSINLVSVLSDWHIGARGFRKRMAVGTPYSSEVRTQRLKALRLEMAKYRSRFRGQINHIHGFILGDMIDDPLSNTFPHQAVEQDLYGAQQVVEAVRSLSEHIIYHWDLFGVKMTWYLIRGNHGYDFEEVLYYWLQDHLKEYKEFIEIKVYNGKYAEVKDDFSDTQIIGLHGDGSANEDRILAMFENGAKNRLILHGHLHHLKVVEIPRGYRVQCPSLMGGNSYSQGFQADSKAGQIFVELHEDGPRPVQYFPIK